MTIDSRSLNDDGNILNRDDVHSTINEKTNNDEESERNVGFWLRLAAYIIDIIIISSVNGILLGPLLFFNDGFPIEISLWTVNGMIATLVYYLYFLLFTKYFQQTLGKMIMGIKVIQCNQTPLTWGDVFYREVVGRIIHNVFFFLKLLYLIIAFTKEKQGIHDMIGNTRVVYIS